MPMPAVNVADLTKARRAFIGTLYADEWSSRVRRTQIEKRPLMRGILTDFDYFDIRLIRY